MNKKLLVILTAALLLLSATACKNGKKNNEDTTTDDASVVTTGAYIDVGTDEDGNIVTSDDPETDTTPETEGFDPTEQNPTFTDVEMKAVVVSSVATVRTSTRVEDSNAVGWPSEGMILDVNGECDNWYRISYTVNGESKNCYIAKTVAADSSILDTFTTIENGEEVEVIVDAVYVRSYPSTDSTHSIRGSLKSGTKITRVAINENWSRILYEVTSEGEDGTPVVEIKQYYVSNDCVKVVETTTDAQ